MIQESTEHARTRGEGRSFETIIMGTLGPLAVTMVMGISESPAVSSIAWFSDIVGTSQEGVGTSLLAVWQRFRTSALQSHWEIFGRNDSIFCFPLGRINPALDKHRFPWKPQLSEVFPSFGKIP